MTKERTMDTRLGVMRDAMEAVADMLSLPRDRLGRLDVCSHPARERVRLLHQKYGCEPSKDYMEQCAQVLRAADEHAQELPIGVV